MDASGFHGLREVIGERFKWGDGAGVADTGRDAGDRFAGLGAAGRKFAVSSFRFKIILDFNDVVVRNARFLVAHDVTRRVDARVKMFLQACTIVCTKNLVCC